MRRALIVGIDDYSGSPLKGCVNDATDMAAVLGRHGALEGPDTADPNFSTQLLTSPPTAVTTARLRMELEKLFATECDVALFYFSGHGFVRSAEGWLVTNDAASYAEGVSMTEILRMANYSKVRDKVVILDCCHSGQMGTPNLAPGGLAELSEGLTVLTASRDTEPALEKGGRGVFTSLVVGGLEGGAADLRGHVTAGSLYAYVDQALGAWDQRPIFKTNVTRFTSLRQVPPQVPLKTLRRLVNYFPDPQAERPLDPSYEDTEEGHDPEKVRIFKDLQGMEGVGLIVPVAEEHMYYAAMNSTGCRLTALGAQYWRLAREGKL